MSDPLIAWMVRIIFIGLFVVFLAHFGKFVLGEIWPIVAPLFRQRRR